MNRLTQLPLTLLLILPILAAPWEASAQQSLRSRNSGSVNKLKKGLMDIGVDSLWILAYSQDETTETSRLSLQTGITIRRFIRDNLAVGGRASGFYHSFGEADEERGAMGMLVANYYMRLGSGMFFAPGVSVGGLIGTRESMLPAVGDSNLLGATMGLSLPFAFYAWETFNLRAGFDLLVTVGTATPEQGESSSYTTVDGGFSVGGGYFF